MESSCSCKVSRPRISLFSSFANLAKYSSSEKSAESSDWAWGEEQRASIMHQGSRRVRKSIVSWSSIRRSFSFSSALRFFVTTRPSALEKLWVVLSLSSSENFSKSEALSSATILSEARNAFSTLFSRG